MESTALIDQADSEISLEVVQKLVSQLENRDPRTLPQLPGRIILPSGQDALVKSDSGEHFYSLHKSSQGWSCSCPGHTFHGHCKHTDGLIRYLDREEARLQKAAKALLKEPEESQAQRYQRLKRQKIAEARAAPAMMAPEMMSTAGFKPVMEA